jgi:HlyD family secretion protein
MKQMTIAAVLTLVLLGGGTTLLLSREPASSPSAAQEPRGGTQGVVAEELVVRARVVPQQSVALTFPSKGLVPEAFVSEVLVQEGDVVEQGDVLARLDTRDLELRVAEAEAVLTQAQLAFEGIKAGATPGQIAEARAQLAQAQGRVRATTGSVTAEDIAAARAELEQALAALAALRAGPSSTSVRAAQAAVSQARAKLQSERDRLSAEKSRAELAVQQAANDLRDRQDAYSRVRGENQAIGQPDQQRIDREAAALRDMQNAEADYERARLAYDQARQAEVSGVTAAEAVLEDAQASLDGLRARTDSPEQAAARARVAAAEAELARLQGDQHGGAVDAANAEVQSAQAVLDELLAGPRPTDVTMAEARVRQAEVALRRSQLTLDLAALRAPFSGTIVYVTLKVGEVPASSEPAIVIADLSRWQVVTEDLSETGVLQLAPETPAMISFTALPGVELPGRVIRTSAIGQQSDVSRAVTYTAVVVPDVHDNRLRWNMSAVVRIAPPAP